jgi:putative membrane protein
MHTLTMFLDKIISLVCGLIFLFVLSCDTPSSDSDKKYKTASVISKTLSSDIVFWDYAASSNMLLATLGNLAADKGSTDTIKALGNRSFAFHSNALKQLKVLLNGNEVVQIPDSLGLADRKLVKDFKLLEGEKFNDRYRNFILNTHKLQLERYKEAIGRAENDETRNWLEAMIIHIRKEHTVFADSDSIVQQ